MNWRLTTRESPPGPHFQSERRDSIIRDLPGANTTSSTNHVQDNDMPPHTPSTQPFPRHRRPSILSDAITGGALDTTADAEVKNARAVQVLARVKEKLTGKDFKPGRDAGEGVVGVGGGLMVSEQVDRLIQQATSVENLSQHYVGWCSFW